MGREDGVVLPGRFGDVAALGWLLFTGSGYAFAGRACEVAAYGVIADVHPDLESTASSERRAG